jgi:hypothetical protein
MGGLGLLGVWVVVEVVARELGVVFVVKTGNCCHPFDFLKTCQHFSCFF